MTNPKVQLIITLEESGQVGINGPINDKVLCYGLLDCAKDAIKEYNDRLAKERSGIAIVPAGAVPIRNGR